MTHDEIRHEISTIKKMVAKARRETAESGHFFIWIGVFAIIAVFTINRLETYSLNQFVLPALLVVLVASGVIGYLTVTRQMEKERAQSYHKILCYSVWFACGVSVAVVTILFPLLNVYPWNLTPVLTSLIVGIAVFSSGVIFESRPIIWCSIAWWGGAIAMAFVRDTPRMLIMMGVILLGWILPGLILNRAYRNRGREDGS